MQRICDDVPAFTDTSVFLVLGVTRKFFNCVAFAGRFTAKQSRRQVTALPLLCSLCELSMHILWMLQDNAAETLGHRIPE